MRTLFTRSSQLSAVGGAPVADRLQAPERGLKPAILLAALGVLAVVLQHVPVQARTAFEEFEARKSPAIERQACALARWAVERKLL
ncbi:MAG: hypothetical protein GTN78_06685, partial [Gemmatimonadales bacterium]|nr:hypothetical protein [Gemmatimonadales bacterium]